MSNREWATQLHREIDEAILLELQRRPATTHEIAQSIKRSTSAVGKHLIELQDKGKVMIPEGMRGGGHKGNVWALKANNLLHPATMRTLDQLRRYPGDPFALLYPDDHASA